MTGPTDGPATGPADLDHLLARADGVLERSAAAERRAPADPAVRAALAAVTGPEAPLRERVVGDRVRRGTATWDRVWRDPHALGPEAVGVVQRALVVVARDLGPPGT